MEPFFRMTEIGVLDNYDFESSYFWCSSKVLKNNQKKSFGKLPLTFLLSFKRLFLLDLFVAPFFWYSKAFFMPLKSILDPKSAFF